MKTYEIYYLVNNQKHHIPYDADSLKEAILDAKYDLEDCKGFKVLENETI